MPTKRKPRAPAQRTTPDVPEELAGISERLAQVLAAEDLNATQFAELADVSTQLVTRLLKGERRDGIKAASVIKLAKAGGVRAGWLLTGETPMRREPIPIVSDSWAAADIVRATLVELGYEPARGEVSKDKSGLPAKGSQ